MDTGVLMSIIIWVLVLVGIGYILHGIRKLIKAKEQNRKAGYKIWVCISTVFTAVLFFGAAFFVRYTTEDRQGMQPKANYPASIENITYGQAIDASCEDVKWSGAGWSQSDSGETFFQMDGKYIVDGKNQRITIQFNYGRGCDTVKESTPFEISFIGLDGAENAYEDEMEDIMYSMFKAYADKHNISLDESVKDGILYTEGWDKADE